MKKPNVKGFLTKPKLNASKGVYRGRFTCPDVQWTGEGADVLATFTITAEELFDSAENQLLWTDQDVQRGIVPGLETAVPRELSLSSGYPNPKFYIFDAKNADDITEKLLYGERVFLSPLVWNLRPGLFQAYWHNKNRELYVYKGKIYLPDSHHRQQAIVKAVRLWNESPRSYPRFSDKREFKVELYFLSKEDEGNYFFDKNQRPKPTAKSKAYDLTTQDDLSLLAKKVINKTPSLSNNINRVTDRLTARNPQVMTLSTLREMMRTFAPAESLETPEMEGLATVAGRFYEMLTEVRPELGHLSVTDRRAVREHLVVDAAVMMHGYAALMREFNNSIAEVGPKVAADEWRTKLLRFSSRFTYRFKRWTGDLFDKKNPLWQRAGIVKPGRDGTRLTVLNTGAARGECGRILKQLAAVNRTQTDLEFLVNR